jgi:hypothetical protein
VTLLFHLLRLELKLSLVVSFFVAVAVLALVVGLASVLIHPHVCALMQGDWVPEPEHDAQRAHR